MATTPSRTISIRPAAVTDTLALLRLAALDSRRPPHGEVIVAEADGALRAAIGVDDAVAIADPFVATRDLVELLRVHATRLRGCSHPTRLGVARTRRLHPAGS